MFEKNLESIGLTKKEANLYVELLKLGTQPASIIARRLKSPRSSIQFIAESLVKKGFASKSIRQKITHYTPEKPENLVTILENKKHRYLQSLERQKEEIETILPSLQDLAEHHSYAKPQISFYEGVEGLAGVYEDILTSKETVRTMVSYTEAHKKKPEKVSIFKRRAAKGIKSKCIMCDSPLARERTANNEKELRESVIIDPKKYFWVPEIQIYDKKVNIASVDENIGVIIESEHIANAMKVLYDLAWIGAEQEEID